MTNQVPPDEPRRRYEVTQRQWIVIAGITIVLALVLIANLRHGNASSSTPAYHLNGGTISEDDWAKDLAKYIVNDSKFFCAPLQLSTAQSRPEAFASGWHGWHKVSGQIANTTEASQASLGYLTDCAQMGR